MKTKFLKFFVLGGLTFGINLGLTYVLINIIFLDKDFSYFIALSLVSIIKFLSSLKLIFGVNYHYKTLISYLSVLISFMLVNFFGTTFLVNFLGENLRYIIIFFVTSFFFILKFFVYNRFVFIKRI